MSKEQQYPLVTRSLGVELLAYRFTYEVGEVNRVSCAIGDSRRSLSRQKPTRVLGLDRLLPLSISVELSSGTTFERDIDVVQLLDAQVNASGTQEVTPASSAALGLHVCADGIYPYFERLQDERSGDHALWVRTERQSLPPLYWPSNSIESTSLLGGESWA